MFTFKALTTVFALVACAVVNATPLALTKARRDVVVPKIIKPDASSVWPVGSVQTVTWDTSNFPPDSQITNPIGRVVLGFDENDSLNLQLDKPLAQGFKLRDGSVTLTVPDVPPRDDYLIVLFGNSGNTSPSFAITRISGGGNSTSSSAPSSPSSSVTSSTSESLITTPIPITGSVITGGSPSLTPSDPALSTPSAPLPTSTSPSAASSVLDDATTSPTPTPTAPLAANIGAAVSLGGSCNINMLIVSMIPMLALVVF
ncbi:hypothetical protein CVT24_012653 [Panaeolus cyanescens]|uniref:Yeast cell wall synthesis Kre9/Knh1-like N-terminal domain-containing protein n=1 Tax=Panaeolus cyanescens TaxID=181874 RepID=A0A409WUN3_9AGAR|nr:hypothetical protein CVT24_012653 [Panaeolus cyanescens]